MRLGLLGGLANNIYILAQALARAGADVCFIRDRGDTYPFSQPVWQDVELTLPFAEVDAAARWGPTEWAAFERAHGWTAPAWLHDPYPPGRQPGRLQAVEVVLRGLLGGGRRPHAAPTLAALRRCDALIVCGLEPEILARLSGRPYVILPHGGDMALAAGIGMPASSRRSRVRRRLLVQTLRHIFRAALWVGCQDATGCGGHKGDVYAALPFLDQRQLPLPYSLRARLPRAERAAQLASVLEQAGVTPPDADLTVLVPSRVDMEWKGQDRLLAALPQVAQRERLHFLFTGWGVDYERLAARCRAEGLEGSISFLPVTFSRPLLFRLLGAVDLVADQFLHGAYGTSAAEAMSCGTPLLTWIDEAAFRARGFPVPPVLLAQEPDQIAAQLEAITTGALDLEAQSRETLRFMEEVHEEGRVARQLLADLERELSATIGARGRR